jgi:rhodanese-related sulfurtransferase
MTSTRSDRVDVSTVRARLDQPDAVTVLDVRTPAEFETVHIRGSYNVPLNLLDEHAEQFAARLDRDIVLVCASGVRATQARQRLAAVGVDRTQVLDGGITAYAAAGAPDGSIVRGRARWALDRQVRFVSGVLVLAGLAVGLRAPKARLLSAGIATGLTVSALTDVCVMARILSALPYNRGPRDRTLADVLAQLPTARQAA